MFASIDWSRPWFASVRDAANLLQGRTDWLEALNEASGTGVLCNHHGLPIRFVPQSDLPNGVAYEAFISETGRVPTRSNLHDYFNALVWLTFPTIKRTLNELQATQIAARGIGTARGSTRDVATLFDENAALFVVANNYLGNALTAALRSHDWPRLFVEQRSSFGMDADVHLFGHALMEKLTHPFKAITAHAWIVRAPDDFFHLAPAAKHSWLDQQVAAELRIASPNPLQATHLTPLPVLGIPGWHPDQDLAFYQDTRVFRPKRSAD
jgi:hypothetical protein